ncbi:MAG: hypothetical protein VCC00_08120 [Deltaproteobacteria bacterium]
MPKAEFEWIPIISGRAWALGLDVPAELIGTEAALVLADVDPGLAGRIRAGDMLVAGRFGDGIADDRPIRALLGLGIGAVLTDAIDERFAAFAAELGLRVVVLSEALGIRTGDELRVDFEGTRVVNHSTGNRYPIRNLDNDLLKQYRRSIEAANA